MCVALKEREVLRKILKKAENSLFFLQKMYSMVKVQTNKVKKVENMTEGTEEGRKSGKININEEFEFAVYSECSKYLR